VTGSAPLTAASWNSAWISSYSPWRNR
jgi:hypothetical protein